MPTRRSKRIFCSLLTGILILLNFLSQSPVRAGGSPGPSTFGVEVQPPTLNNPSMMSLLSQTGNYWARTFIINWSSIEPVKSDPPIYHWEMVNKNALQNASSMGLQIIADVKFTPSWAQKIPGVSCGPILASEFTRFAQFMQALVSRYSVPPYSVKYWELGNEPDVDPGLVPPNNDFGCWGDSSDDYYGGGYYADMLKVVYPAIKATDPGAQVLNGGLLLDCDPEHPPAGSDCKPGKFLEGILRHNGANDGGNYFDILSFHAYPPYMNTQGVKPLGLDEQNPNWLYQTGVDGVGGVVMGKIHFLRSMMSKYGLSKPLMQTEASLVCPEWNDQCNPTTGDLAAFYQSQADYVVWLYVRNMAAGVQGTIWYSFEDPSWRYAGLLDKLGQPKPAFTAYNFLTHELAGVDYGGTVTQYPGVRGYEFRKANNWVWVLWAPDESPHTITLPVDTLTAYDLFGNTISVPANKSLTVSRPVYVELSPDIDIPTVSWVLPAQENDPYYFINGFSVDLEATANDNGGISNIYFFRWDSINLEHVDIGHVYTPPYTWTLDATTLNYGWNEIDVKAYDSAGTASDQQRIYLFRWYLIILPIARR